ncbi:hypothetical protein GCM10027036_20620 [Flavihumibacter cheonanensis]|uniref:PEX28-32 family peroxisomal membrane protein n=1 Tax=Flavihumibacter cheonanensis TaxID=1442385 RepID=UPI001EF98C1B|nr:PEX28-32 family peroxisomal membrane protein [Flavihumibacter cheonanensis]MCG7754194.1 PEX28-32 family peroxisomal membrane protein [Flavihumibacter cheonanensis]
MKDTSLINSEISILLIPHTKFNPDSWHLYDPFIKFAVDVLGISIASLVACKSLNLITEATDQFSLFGRSILKSTNHLVELEKWPTQEITMGWLEEVMIDQFKLSPVLNMNIFIHDTLDHVFNGKNDYSNPGKVLILEIIEHQKLNLFKYSKTNSLFTNYTLIDLNRSTLKEINPQIHKLEDFFFPEIEISVLRKKIKKQLIKFQNLD